MATQKVFTPGQESLAFLESLIDDSVIADSVNMKPYELSPDNQETSIRKLISKVDILDFGDQGYLLKNLFCTEECTYYISEGEHIGFKDIYACKKEYRNATRIMVKSQELADTLWNRLQPYLKSISIDADAHQMHIHGPASLLHGTWKPLRLNPIFRLCKYEPGGHFAPHFDGHFAVSSKQRSMKTLMLYLNEQFTFGTTNFVDESQTLYMDSEGKYCAEEKNIVYRIKPEAGMAVVFNHHRLHEGQAVRDGVKYILRTDILFAKDEEISDPTEEMAFQLLQQAERLEGDGDCMRAMELYRKAFKLSPSLEASYG